MYALQHTDGRWINVQINFQTGIATVWLDTNAACSPTFQTETHAREYHADYLQPEYPDLQPAPLVYANLAYSSPAAQRIADRLEQRARNGRRY